jgi:hypothetical protein
VVRAQEVRPAIPVKVGDGTWQIATYVLAVQASTFSVLRGDVVRHSPWQLIRNALTADATQFGTLVINV